MSPVPRRRQFGTIETLPSGRHRAYYKGPDGKRHKAPRTYQSPDDAAAWLRAEQRLIEFDEWTPPATRTQTRDDKARTVGQWMDEWMQLRSHGPDALEPSTAQNYAKDIRLRITHTSGKAARLRDIPLTQLTKRDVAAWWDAITIDHAPTACFNTYKRLRTALAAAVERDMIPANPATLKEATKRPKLKKKELPTRQILQDIVNELDHTKPRVDGSHKLIAILTFFHGLRIGEALGLRRGDIEDQGETILIHIRGNCYRSQEPGVGMVRKDTVKTDAGYRTIPIFPAFHDDVRWHLDHRAAGRRDAMLFTTGAGKIVTDTSYRSILDRAKTRAGHKGVTITPHYGRNWVITTLAEAGMPIPAIGEFLGQRDLRTITEVYMRATDDRKAAVLDAVNATLTVPDGVGDLDAKRQEKTASTTPDSSNLGHSDQFAAGAHGSSTDY
ncbi:tyrosine-type recombinase/integrase [Corynebacterium kefirresidentii]|uniref:tyrosine-type recombinase/integrase n=1 Tax=Corynebacterium kefirresidentii TaxID=1979527 RepID=UPI000A36859D|nr:site-specific integrase [Corynebacterium kefirresidentii]OUJ22368.1 integrase [Corynebacterium kefirresidentii]